MRAVAWGAGLCLGQAFTAVVFLAAGTFPAHMFVTAAAATAAGAILMWWGSRMGRRS